MSKSDNLHDFLVDIAKAIREKKGTTEPINAQRLSEEIRSIESGTTEVEEKDINFYDYDGTLLFSYTIPEAQALTELPTPKGHQGLIFDGWNWDYEDVISLDYPMNIGAMYRTDDGKTRLYLKVEEPTSISLSFNNTGTATVDFGDGDVVETSEATPVLPHRYEVGEYVLRIDGKIVLIAEENNNILGGCELRSSTILKKVELGDNTTIGTHAFEASTNLKSITIPSTLPTKIKGRSFYSCSSLRCINLPKGEKDLLLGQFNNCSALFSVIMPKGFISLKLGIDGCRFSSLTIPDGYNETISYSEQLFIRYRIPNTNTYSSFNSCRCLRNIEEPASVTTRGNSCYYNCRALQKAVLSPNINELGSNIFGYCVTLRDVVFLCNITSISNNAFTNCTCLPYLDFSGNTSIPTLANVNAFNSTICKFIVPDALYDEWIVATNWSTYADRIVKASEYVEPTTE